MRIEKPMIQQIEARIKTARYPQIEAIQGLIEIFTKLLIALMQRINKRQKYQLVAFKKCYFRGVKVVSGVKNLKSPFSQGSVVTIGNFDGLHLGHQHLISAVKKRASGFNLPSVLVTFRPHPIQVLRPKAKLKLIFGVEDLQDQLGKMGLDTLIIEPFSMEFSKTGPEVFIQEYIALPLAPKALIVGHDFSFGAARAGGMDQLVQLAKKYGFELDILSPVKVKGEVVSSTRIRQLLAEGQVDLVSVFLGRHYYIAGKVERGEKRGTQIGFPTANLCCPVDRLIRPGVYCTRIKFQDKVLLGVTNIGRRPTFEPPGGAFLVETHIMDFKGDLYDKNIKVEFLYFLREEKKFNSPAELIRQIEIDIQSARGRLEDAELG